MGRRKKAHTITGEVLPPGVLAPNPYNPNGRLTPEERWELILESCAEIIASAVRRTQNAAPSRTPH